MSFLLLGATLQGALGILMVLRGGNMDVFIITTNMYVVAYLMMQVWIRR